MEAHDITTISLYASILYIKETNDLNSTMRAALWFIKIGESRKGILPYF